MTIGEILVRVLASVVFGAIPFALLFATGPPRHGSWWYPNPDRWDCGFKVLLYAFIDANTPSRPVDRWFVGVVVSLVLGGILAGIWLQPLCR
jgi:hypothetical protein